MHKIYESEKIKLLYNDTIDYNNMASISFELISVSAGLILKIASLLGKRKEEFLYDSKTKMITFIESMLKIEMIDKFDKKNEAKNG